MQISIFIAQESFNYLGFKKIPHVNRIFFAFCVYKNIKQKQNKCIQIKSTMTAMSERQRAQFYIYKKETNAKRFYIQKARHFTKSKIICVMFLNIKSRTLCVTRLFMEFLKLAEGGGIFIF